MTLLDEVRRIEQEALERIGNAGSLDVLKELQIQFLGRQGALTAVLKSLGALPVDERKAVGAQANTARKTIEEKLQEATDRLSQEKPVSAFDPTLPGTGQPIGTIHILNQVMREICDIFHGMGFEIARGPHVETDYYNFEALNFAPDHPARDEHDTFFVDGGRLLRTHTTPVQARELEKRKPPMKILMPGRTFRHEDISTRAHVSFHQIDGFMVAEGVSIADLKGVLNAFAHSFFGEDLKLRFRPSYFPFTECSAEVDVACYLCRGKGCQLCKQTGWLEILGSGMIHPNVLRFAGHDPEKYTGFAFGIGVERPAMLKYRINDIRLFFNSNLRFLKQFN
ncbi:phenylalanine--tRNA ligase subunit alpha [candidate division GN15 bacterium]|uniref:Phenylalanine--tRNA ligase alpha subunit n=1 Tax=candidate division GN15 bacterium TaxID=2072418 RepID=A0A855X571_9BACT|nr:MAG: phenylalanine--tRNA ligase subunit alpha [candidate division GN15 bacterium]